MQAHKSQEDLPACHHNSADSPDGKGAEGLRPSHSSVCVLHHASAAQRNKQTLSAPASQGSGPGSVPFQRLTMDKPLWGGLEALL